MGKVYEDITELIGCTPLLHIGRFEKERALSARLLVKIEAFNPAGSAKDRIAKKMIEDAVKHGVLKPGATIIEPTSGNTGIGIASVACALGFRTILTMPETMSSERMSLLRAYGAELVLTEGSLGMQGAVEQAERLADEIDGSVILGQFTNPSNVRAHYETTGPEIWEDTDGKIDAFVAGVGTGGTLTGTAQYLKEKNANIQIIAMEPADSPLLSTGRSGSHKLQGIGANFVPEIFEMELVDEIITVTTEEAYGCVKELVKTEGILAGISSGACLAAACRLAERPEYEKKTIVALLPDSGERYLSTELFS